MKYLTVKLEDAKLQIWWLTCFPVLIQSLNLPLYFKRRRHALTQESSQSLKHTRKPTKKVPGKLYLVIV